MSLSSRPAGFTIIEVLMTLAISGAIFITAIGLFNSQTSETAFSQTMQDLDSQISARLKEISTNLSGSYRQFSCMPVAGADGKMRAVLSSSGQPNNDCLYIGKAILAPKNDSTVYFFTILGNRQSYGASNQPSGIVSRFDDSNPVPASGPPPAGTPDLTEKYSLHSAKITDTKITTASGSVTDNYFLAAYYTDLQGGIYSSPDSNAHLLAKAYLIGTPSSSAYYSKTKECITSVGSCAAAQDIASWTLCFADTNGSRTARLDIYSSASGTTTNLQFNVQCP